MTGHQESAISRAAAFRLDPKPGPDTARRIAHQQRRFSDLELHRGHCRAVTQQLHLLDHLRILQVLGAHPHQMPVFPNQVNIVAHPGKKQVVGRPFPGASRDGKLAAA